MISEESIKEVRERASITEIVSDSVVLKRQGRSLTGLCPFHSERSPSFHVHEDDGYYHCFGCGASGNVISFVMTSRGLFFPEAIEYLAERYGIELKKSTGTKSKRGTDWSKEIFNANKMALEYFQHQLKKAPKEVSDYVVERGLSAEMVKDFAIGFAGKERSALVEFLKKNGVSEERQIQAGLARRNERGEIYDTFRGRLIFPIALDSRRVAAFGGRIIPTIFDQETLARAPKYLNSPESPVYEKRKTLFGLPQAIRSMREHGCVYIVEGYMDVVSLAQAGVGEVVATCGTALTEEHLRRLSRLTKRVILLFDGDAAGRQAAGRSFQIALNAEIDIFALFLPTEDDPDTIARTYGDKTREYLEQLEKVSLFECYLSMMAREFQVERLSELGPASIDKIAAEVAKILKQVKRPVVRERLIEDAAFRLRLKVDTLTTMIEGGKAESTSEKSIEKSVVQPEVVASIPINKLSRIDREILSAVMILRERVCAEILHDALVCEALHPTVLRFVSSFRDTLIDDSLNENEKKGATREMLQNFGGSWIAHWKEAHAIAAVPESNLLKSFEECVKHIRGKQLISAEIRELEAQLESVGDEHERLLVHQKRLNLERRLRDLTKPSAN